MICLSSCFRSFWPPFRRLPPLCFFSLCPVSPSSTDVDACSPFVGARSSLVARSPSATSKTGSSAPRESMEGRNQICNSAQLPPLPFPLFLLDKKRNGRKEIACTPHQPTRQYKIRYPTVHTHHPLSLCLAMDRRYAQVLTIPSPLLLQKRIKQQLPQHRTSIVFPLRSLRLGGNHTCY